jgi:hypothetical protein
MASDNSQGERQASDACFTFVEAEFVLIGDPPFTGRQVFDLELAVFIRDGVVGVIKDTDAAGHPGVDAARERRWGILGHERDGHLVRHASRNRHIECIFAIVLDVVRNRGGVLHF